MANLPIPLYDGMKIGQISFQRLSSPVERAYGDPALGSRYRGQTDPTASRYFADFERDAPGAAGDPVTEPLYAITPPSEARVFAGGVRVRIVRAGWFRPDAGGFFGVVPQALWTRFAQTDERGRIRARLNLLLVEAGGKRILVETGTGVGMSDKNRDIKGVEGGTRPRPCARWARTRRPRLRRGQPFALRPRRRHGRDGWPAGVSECPLRRATRRGAGRARGRAPAGRDHGSDQLDAIQAAGQLAEVHGEVELVEGVTVTRTGSATWGSQAVLLGGAGARARRRAMLDSHPLAAPRALDECLRRLPDRGGRRPARSVSRAAAEDWWCYFSHDPGEAPIQIAATEKGFLVRAE